MAIADDIIAQQRARSMGFVDPRLAKGLAQRSIGETAEAGARQSVADRQRQARLFAKMQSARLNQELKSRELARSKQRYDSATNRFTKYFGPLFKATADTIIAAEKTGLFDPNEESGSFLFGDKTSGQKAISPRKETFLFPPASTVDPEAARAAQEEVLDYRDALESVRGMTPRPVSQVVRDARPVGDVGNVGGVDFELPPTLPQDLEFKRYTGKPVIELAERRREQEAAQKLLDFQQGQRRLDESERLQQIASQLRDSPPPRRVVQDQVGDLPLDLPSESDLAEVRAGPRLTDYREGLKRVADSEELKRVIDTGVNLGLSIEQILQILNRNPSRRMSPLDRSLMTR